MFSANDGILLFPFSVFILLYFLFCFLFLLHCLGFQTCSLLIMIWNASNF